MTYRFFQTTLSLLFVALFFACGIEPNEINADYIFKNGTLFSADSVSGTAVAVFDGRIVMVGTDEEVMEVKGETTQVIDLQGAFLMPGLIEGHGHFESLGRSLINVNLLGMDSWEVALERVAEKVKAAEAGAWIEGRGWHQEKWANLPSRVVQGYPLHNELSLLSPNNPVVLTHASGHALMANAMAMELAGISVETPDPVGGRILRDAMGNPTGVFEENAMIPIENALENYKKSQTEAEQDARFRKAILLAGQHCIEQGITSFQDAGSTFEELSRYRNMAEEGVLPLRLWAMVLQPKEHEFPKLDGFPWIGLGNDFLTVRAVKCYFDGALGSYGAWLLEPYSDKAGFEGQNTTPTDSVARLADLCVQRGMQCCVHAIGDRGNREVLDIFQTKLNGDKDKRWRIEHAQHLHPSDIPRFSELGVIASMQAIHCTSDAPFVEKRLGKERARTGAYPWRSLLDSGARMANGTDAPVEEVNPLACLYASVTRRRPDSGLEFYPEQSMTREEALLSYTLWNAYAAFQESEKGSISVGKKADLVVFDKDLLTCSEEEILSAKVLLTVLNGKIAYENRPNASK